MLGKRAQESHMQLEMYLKQVQEQKKQVYSSSTKEVSSLSYYKKENRSFDQDNQDNIAEMKKQQQ